MAPPVPFKKIIRTDSAAEVRKRLEDAPLAHEEAILSGYDLLQKLHESGALEVLRGAAGARDALVNQLAGVLDTPEAVVAMRNLIVMAKTLGSIDPGLLKGALEGMAQTAAGKTSEEPPSLWRLFQRVRSRDARRGLAATLGILEAFGRAVQSRRTKGS